MHLQHDIPLLSREVERQLPPIASPMKYRSLNLSVLLGVAIVFIAAAAVFYFMGQTCTVETLMSPVISPNRQAAIDLYSKKCHPRWSDNPKREKEFQVIVLRPISEPQPEGNRYKEADVVFEMEKGPRPMQFLFASPDSFAFMNKVPEAERKDSLLIGCYLTCPSVLIRKQASSWRGQPIHYFRTETPTGPVITQ
ncbi:MAG TPA: hypothetical protein VN875_05050 [Candidatus Binatus sp.]|jgi:hypothetical protein|nr:hypothetical protein [Candidatus Binatus sp.]